MEPVRGRHPGDMDCKVQRMSRQLEAQGGKRVVAHRVQVFEFSREQKTEGRACLVFG
jgi:hypothetical protein